MSNEVVSFLQPTNLEDAIKAAELLAASSFVPEAYKNKPGDILAAGQMGAELGVSWMQALQNIAVINGRPSVWGDLSLALCMKHPDFVDCLEEYDEDTRTAKCTAQRRGRKDRVQTFSWADACQAELHTKNTYQKYRRRMLQMRARSWALRDQFPDAFKGLYVAEEAMDIPPLPTDIEGESTLVDASGAPLSGMDALEQHLNGHGDAGPTVDSKHPEGSVEWWHDALNQADTLAALEKVGFELRASDPEAHEQLRAAYETRLQTIKDELSNGGDTPRSETATDDARSEATL